MISAVSERDIAAVLPSNRASNAETEPTPPVSELRERSSRKKGANTLLTLLWRNARTVVFDQNDDAVRPREEAHLGGFGIFDGIIHEVGDRTAKGSRPAPDIDATRPCARNGSDGIRGVLADGLDQHAQFGKPAGSR